MFTIRNSTKLTISLCVSIMFFISGSNISFAGKNNKNSNQDIKKTLKETKIESMTIKDMKVSDVVKMLSEKYKIKIILLQPLQEKQRDAVVELVIKKKNLYQLIYYFCKAADLKFRIRENAIIMSATPIPPTAEEIQREKERKKAGAVIKKKWKLSTEKKLKKIIFPEVKLENADIFTVIRYLNRHGKRNDPNKKGVPVIAGFTMKTAKKLPKITMRYSDISMYEILEHLYKGARIQYNIEDGVVILFDNTGKGKKGPNPETVALKVAERWLALLDAGKFQESQKYMFQGNKKKIPLEGLLKTLQFSRKMLGGNISRTLESKRYYTSRPDFPKGKYFVFKFNADFENQNSMTETITVMLDKDGEWRISEFAMKS